MSELNKWEQSIVDRLRYGSLHNQPVTLGADEVHIPMNAIIECGERRTGSENKPLTCDGCKVYAALQRYHRQQEQCPDCKGCIRTATDRYQKVSK